MAKVSGPMMSLDARGKFAGALVFSNWKGRPTVRQLVTPSNPQSLTQQNARNMMRAAAEMQSWANRTALKSTPPGTTDKIALIAKAPGGQAWNGFLVKNVVGVGQANWLAAEAIWTPAIAGSKTIWDNAAANLNPPMKGVAQKGPGGTTITALTAGQVYFHYRSALAAAGVLALAPLTGTAPTYV